MAQDSRIRMGWIADDDLGIACQAAAEAALRKDATAAVAAVLRFARRTMTKRVGEQQPSATPSVSP